MRQKVFILGATGNVGSELIRQISQDDGIDKNVNPTDIIGIAGSNRVMFHESAFPKELLQTITATKGGVKDLLQSQGQSYASLTDILVSLKHLGYAGDVIIVDATGAKGEAIKQFHIDALGVKYDFSIVTANKNVVSLENIETFKTVTENHGTYDYDTAVMAGAGAVDFIIRAKDTHDKVHAIEGCFSGTLGYIASELEKGEKKFSSIVREALEKGYTEPHPWDDLSGLDVARKLIILARTAGYEVEMSDIQVQGFIDNRYGDIKDVGGFLKAIESEDEIMAQRYAQALSKGNTLKYIASMKVVEDRYAIIGGQNNGKKIPKIILEVKLQEVPLESTLGSLKGTNNIARIETRIYSGQRAWTLIAPGAGLDTTALSIRAGIASMLPQGMPRANGEC